MLDSNPKEVLTAVFLILRFCNASHTILKVLKTLF